MTTDVKNIISKLKIRKKKQLAGFTVDPMVDENRYYEKFGEYARPRELFRRLPKRLLEKLLESSTSPTKLEKKRLRKIEELLGVSTYA